MSVKFDLTNLTEEQMVSIMKSVKNMQTAVEMFVEKYGIILPLYSGEGTENSDVYAGMTFKQFESLTLTDVAYAILKNVQAISENEGMTAEQVVEKGLEDVDWYKKALKDAVETKNTFVIPQMRYPCGTLFPKDYMSQDIFKNRGHDFVNSLETIKNKTKIYYNLIFSDGSLDKKLTYKDRIVCAAVISIFDVGNEYFWLSNLHRTITWNKDAKLTPEIVKDLTKSLDKLRTTLLTADVKDEMNIKKWTVKEPKLKETLLQLSSVPGVYNGEFDECFRILTEPILLKYANWKGQILRIPSEYLSIPKLNMTEKHQILVYKLYEEISLIKKGGRNEVISYNTLFEYLEMDSKKYTPVQFKRIRDTITNKILCYWVGCRLIKSYENVKKGNAITGVKILF